jgi:hypothetical protein
MTHLRPLVPGDASPDALVTDQYLDALLGAADRRTAGAFPDTDPDPAIRHAGTVLRTSLVRVHPSFRFEDRLASRLANLAAERGSRAAVGSGDVIPFHRAAAGRGIPADRDPLLDAVLAGTLDPTDAGAVERASGGRGTGRPLLVGGAITSAAISIAGVAYVAWRASRPGRWPASAGSMARAARVAHARRDAMAGGAGGPA